MKLELQRELEMRIELDKRRKRENFWEFCKSQAPDYYHDGKIYLKDMALQLQEFYSNDEELLVINVPPRHGKTRTMKLFCAWVLGRNVKEGIMVGSYNEDYATDFSKGVLGHIQDDTEIRLAQQISDGRYSYSDIFPGVQTKSGREKAGSWDLEGGYNTFLATSPGGSATGRGTNWLIIDDLIKNSEEAFNPTQLEKHHSWFTNTMLSRLEKQRKIIIVMTRWSVHDLAGKLIRTYEQENWQHLYRVVKYEVKDENGKLLDEETFNERAYQSAKKQVDAVIFFANYYQKEVETTGGLYKDLQTYDKLPPGTVKAMLDMADSGKDYLCMIIYLEYGHKAYILDVLYTPDTLETTEQLIARMLKQHKVSKAKIERNQGGGIAARNIENNSRKLGNFGTLFETFYQNKNKEARIRSGASYVINNIYFPINWETTYPIFYQDILAYIPQAKNQRDDAPDTLTLIAEDLEAKTISQTITMSVRL